MYADQTDQAMYQAKQNAVTGQRPPGHTNNVMGALHNLGDTLSDAMRALDDTRDRLFGPQPEAQIKSEGLSQVRSGITGDIEGFIESLQNRARQINALATELQSRL